MEASTETVVRREIAIAAHPETVWQFLVQPEKATRWMGQAASLDPRPGGEYRVEVISGNTAVGEFVEVDPPNRLVWTWGWTDESQSPVFILFGQTPETFAHFVSHVIKTLNIRLIDSFITRVDIWL